MVSTGEIFMEWILRMYEVFLDSFVPDYLLSLFTIHSLASITVFYDFDSLGTQWIRCEWRVVFFYCMTIRTTLELDSIFFFLMTLTEGKKFFSRKLSSMHDSFFKESFEYTIECRLVHLQWVNECGFERTQGSSLLLDEVWEDMSSMDGWQHKKTSGYNSEV
jgi:hypothetical protein